MNQLAVKTNSHSFRAWSSEATARFLGAGAVVLAPAALLRLICERARPLEQLQLKSLAVDTTSADAAPRRLSALTRQMLSNVITTLSTLLALTTAIHHSQATLGSAVGREQPRSNAISTNVPIRKTTTMSMVRCVLPFSHALLPAHGLQPRTGSAHTRNRSPCTAASRAGDDPDRGIRPPHLAPCTRACLHLTRAVL